MVILNKDPLFIFNLLFYFNIMKVGGIMSKCSDKYSLSDELDRYISSIILDFTRDTHYEESVVSIEKKHQVNTRAAIIALFKMHKGFL